MKRALGVVAIVALVVLAGCAQFSFGESPSPAPDASTTSPQQPQEPANFTDPSEDVLGWENGYWHNETLPFNASDDLSEDQLEDVIARSMARVEVIRGIEFESEVPVEVITRAEYREEHLESDRAEAFETFDNAKFEALFLVGEDRDALSIQDSNRGQSVLGFYSPEENQIVVVSEGNTTSVDETTLGHELLHALQFDQFDADSINRSTRERYNARGGLVEGDARLVDQLYQDRCEGDWSCITPPAGGNSGSSDFHIGVYIMQYFPYSDGPVFVSSFRSEGGWEAVNDLYDRPPESSEQVIDPSKYRQDHPTDVPLPDESDVGWERVDPDRDGAPYASFGQSGLAAMFAYPSYDDSGEGGVVGPRTFLNVDEDTQEINRTDPFNYDFAAVNGWDGDKLWVYDNEAGEGGYVWRIVWDSPEDAREFAATYRDLLEYWGGERVDGRDDRWRIPDGPFADAFSIRVDGDTVTIVNAPTVDDLGGVHAPAGA